jgi:hypothetical protein
MLFFTSSSLSHGAAAGEATLLRMLNAGGFDSVQRVAYPPAV